MDAKTAHLAKFSAGYRKLYPYTNQLVVGSKADIFILPKFLLVRISSLHVDGSLNYLLQKQRLKPAVILLKSLGVVGSPSTPHRILSHALSNGICSFRSSCVRSDASLIGGLCQLNLLSQLLPPASKAIGQGYLSSAVVLDSTPGGDDLASAIYVFKTTIRNPLLRCPILVTVIFIQFLSFLLGRVPWHLHDIIRKAVCNPKWLPWIGPKTPFLYIYLKADKSVPYRHIQAHTEMAESKGQDVTRLVFDTSPHVEHMRIDPERYWKAIAALWTKAISA